MSSLTASVLAAVRGRKKASRIEEDPERDAPEEEIEEKDAEGEEDETSAEDEDDDKAAEGEEEETEASEDDDEPKAKTAHATARRAEQARIQAILTHPKADANPGLAAQLAFGKRFYSAGEAGALLASSAAGTGRLANRMAGKSPAIGAGPAPNADTKSQSGRIFAAASQMIAAKRAKK